MYQAGADCLSRACSEVQEALVGREVPVRVGEPEHKLGGVISSAPPAICTLPVWEPIAVVTTEILGVREARARHHARWPAASQSVRHELSS
jgi:hypothetical protein